jgi:hypothetical protein
MRTLKQSAIALNLLLGMRRMDQEIFGKMNSPISQTRVRKASPPKGQPAQGRCLCRNPMPLDRTERDLLASLHGKVKKKFVKQLKIKYGRA